KKSLDEIKERLVARGLIEAPEPSAMTETSEDEPQESEDLEGAAGEELSAEDGARAAELATGDEG
ncbi:MAG TPA: hypothetical protein VGE98_05385, partial [Thermoanaerobaculia bacterium]